MADPGILVLISANIEWQAVLKIVQPEEERTSSLGSWFRKEIGSHQLIFFHGGWGKVSAAASAQYAIDTFHPTLLVNLGTCGGFQGCIERGTVLLVERTVIYDIHEQMGDPQEALAFYTTHLDISWLPAPLPYPVVRGTLVSGDRDLFPVDIPRLRDIYHAQAADWESGAIAWVAKQNGVRCLILRGVSDLVSPEGGEAYGNIDLFRTNTEKVMQQLVEQLPGWVSGL